MRRFIRQILTTALVGLYAWVTAFGPALHALPGLGHVATPLSVTRGGSDSHVASLVSSHDDCPVCHFLTQGQFLHDPASCGRIEVVHLRPADEVPRIVPATGRLLTHPRAPPLA